MRSLPKPLIGLLLGTVAFFALWMVALKPSSSSSSGGSPSGLGQYQSAINKAHQAVTTSNQANARLGAPTATTPTTTAKTATAPAATTKAAPATTTSDKAAAPAAKPTTQSGSAAASAPVSTAAEVQAVENAVRAGNVVAILFYNGAAADDQAMKSELAAIPTHKGQVVKLAVPVTELTQFSMITTQVPVDTSPSLVLIDRARQATALIGYADGVEIAQRIDDALAAKPPVAKSTTN
jgi:hypothetical protein